MHPKACLQLCFGGEEEEEDEAGTSPIHITDDCLHVFPFLFRKMVELPPQPPQPTHPPLPNTTPSPPDIGEFPLLSLRIPNSAFGAPWSPVGRSTKYKKKPKYKKKQKRYKSPRLRVSRWVQDQEKEKEDKIEKEEEEEKKEEATKANDEEEEEEEEQKQAVSAQQSDSSSSPSPTTTTTRPLLLQKWEEREATRWDLSSHPYVQKWREEGEPKKVILSCCFHGNEEEKERATCSHHHHQQNNTNAHIINVGLLPNHKKNNLFSSSSLLSEIDALFIKDVVEAAAAPPQSKAPSSSTTSSLWSTPPPLSATFVVWDWEDKLWPTFNQWGRVRLDRVEYVLEHLGAAPSLMMTFYSRARQMHKQFARLRQGGPIWPKRLSPFELTASLMFKDKTSNPIPSIAPATHFAKAMQHEDGVTRILDIDEVFDMSGSSSRDYLLLQLKFLKQNAKEEEEQFASTALFRDSHFSNTMRSSSKEEERQGEKDERETEKVRLQSILEGIPAAVVSDLGHNQMWLRGSLVPHLTSFWRYLPTPEPPFCLPKKEQETKKEGDDGATVAKTLVYPNLEEDAADIVLLAPFSDDAAFHISADMYFREELLDEIQQAQYTVYADRSVLLLGRGHVNTLLCVPSPTHPYQRQLLQLSVHRLCYKFKDVEKDIFEKTFVWVPVPGDRRKTLVTHSRSSSENATFFPIRAEEGGAKTQGKRIEFRKEGIVYEDDKPREAVPNPIGNVNKMLEMVKLSHTRAVFDGTNCYYRLDAIQSWLSGTEEEEFVGGGEEEKDKLFLVQKTIQRGYKFTQSEHVSSFLAYHRTLLELEKHLTAAPPPLPFPYQVYAPLSSISSSSSSSWEKVLDPSGAQEEVRRAEEEEKKQNDTATALLPKFSFSAPPYDDDDESWVETAAIPNACFEEGRKEEDVKSGKGPGKATQNFIREWRVVTNWETYSQHVSTMLFHDYHRTFTLTDLCRFKFAPSCEEESDGDGAAMFEIGGKENRAQLELHPEGGEAVIALWHKRLRFLFECIAHEQQKQETLLWRSKERSGPQTLPPPTPLVTLKTKQRQKNHSNEHDANMDNYSMSSYVPFTIHEHYLPKNGTGMEKEKEMGTFSVHVVVSKELDCYNSKGRFLYGHKKPKFIRQDELVKNCLLLPKKWECATANKNSGAVVVVLELVKLQFADDDEANDGARET